MDKRQPRRGGEESQTHGPSTCPNRKRVVLHAMLQCVIALYRHSVALALLAFPTMGEASRE
jgi:hypothetical protein